MGPAGPGEGPPMPGAVPAAAMSGPRRRPWQLGLRSLFLLTAAIAAWLTVAVNRREIGSLRARIAAVQPLVHELRVDDPAEIAVVKREPLWYDENVWDVYLPEGPHRLAIATREIDDPVRTSPTPKATMPTPKATLPLPPGRHRIALEQGRDGECFRVAVILDDRPALEVVEPPGWNQGGGWSGSSPFSQGTSLPADWPVTLLRRRFFAMGPSGSAKMPPGPTEGLLLWIEPAD